MGLKLKNINDQVIVITGASSGIGLATAELAAERGARVVLNARSEGDLREVCDRIRARGGFGRHSPSPPVRPRQQARLSTPRRLSWTILLSRYENTARRRSSIR